MNHQISAALTIEYLHPALEAMGVENPQDYVYAFDTAPLTTRPNRTAGTWGEEPAPDDDEKTRRSEV